MKKFIYPIVREIFWVMTAGSFIFLVMELVKPHAVLAYLNAGLWLVFWLFSAIITLALGPKKTNLFKKFQATRLPAGRQITNHK